MKQVRAKFHVTEIAHYIGGGRVKLSAVTATSEENKTFWQYTPSGNIELNIKSEALNFFEVGQEMYIDFSPANEKDILE